MPLEVCWFGDENPTCGFCRSPIALEKAYWAVDGDELHGYHWICFFHHLMKPELERRLGR